MFNCSLGNNLILTHARAVDLYRRNYQREQGGVIGITLVSQVGSSQPVGLWLSLDTFSQDMEWVEPLRDSPEARKAATESVDILAAWVSESKESGRSATTFTDII